MAIKVGGTTVVDDSRNITGISISGLTTPLSIAQGGTGTASTAHTSLTTNVSGTLPVANGGTGVTASTGTTNVVLSNSPTLTTPTIASANLTTALTLAGAAGTNGQVLTSAGSGLPTWTTISSSPTLVRSARSTNTVLAAADVSTLIDLTSGTFSQTFTAAATLGSGWFCYIRNSGTGEITLDPNASELIDGLTTYIMYPGECRLVQCTGTAFTSIVVTPFYQTYTSSGTFTKPPGYSAVSMRVFGPGGGGGAGARRANGNSRGGGAGGGGGALARAVISGLTNGTGYTVTVGAGGTGGAGATADATQPGAVGNQGGTSSFSTLVYSYSGGGGGGGTDAQNQPGTGGGTGGHGTSPGQNGGNPWPSFDMTTANGPLNATGGSGAGCVGNGSAGNAEYGGASGGKNDAASTIKDGGGSIYGGPGGGSGATLNSSNEAKAGGAGGSINSYGPGNGVAGGAATGANGTAGTAGANGLAGGAGGGGGSQPAGAGGSGGAGGAPAAGGGGGAASANGYTSGAGGAGGRGEIQIWGIV